MVLPNSQEEFESYMNRDSLPYIDLYSLGSELTGFARRTLRYPGWCSLMLAFEHLNLLNESPLNTAESSYSEVFGTLSEEHTKTRLLECLSSDEVASVLEKMKCLGVFSRTETATENHSSLSLLASLMVDRMVYAEGETDRIILVHSLKIRKAETRERVDAVLDVKGNSMHSAMALTVGCTAAFAAIHCLSHPTERFGVQLPLQPELYKALLSNLKTQEIQFSEQRTRLRTDS